MKYSGPHFLSEKNFKVEKSQSFHIFLLDIDFLSRKNITFGKSVFHLNSSKQMGEKIEEIFLHTEKNNPCLNVGYDLDS